MTPEQKEWARVELLNLHKTMAERAEVIDALARSEKQLAARIATLARELGMPVEPETTEVN